MIHAFSAQFNFSVSKGNHTSSSAFSLLIVQIGSFFSIDLLYIT